MALENMLGDNFVCPCQHNLNIVICVLYGVVSTLGLICALLFVDPSPEGGKDQVAVCSSSNTQRRLYTVLSVLIWLSLFFLDGRYVACAGSTWEAVYIKSETLGIAKWCKPTGNETSELERHQRTLELMSISQVSAECSNMFFNPTMI